MTASLGKQSRLVVAGLAVTGLLALHAPLRIDAKASVPNDERAIAHALNRLAFGARPGDIARVREVGLAAWIDAQLRPERISNATVDQRLARLSTLTLDARTIAQEFFLPAREERRRRQQQNGLTGNEGREGLSGIEGREGNEGREGRREPRSMDAMSEVVRRDRQVLAELAEAKLLRAVYSERQLEEVLVDFWFNHFNVFARKGQTAIYVGEYEREAIRPHVMGSFRDLLGATAKSPAMLFYLDNWMSAAPNTSQRPALGRRPRRAQKIQSPPAQNRMPKGLNENYARELLELHTLGVDGGYTQQDVVEVARAFTGWTIGRPNAGGFRFVPGLHDGGAKNVLGQSIPSGGGIEDGEKVLDILARHPSTARHISLKLAQRFVSDTPPQSVVDRAARTFQSTNGNLREVVRVIVTSPEFFAPDAYRAKVKTPFEFVASALRATNAEVQFATAAVRALAGLGMPLYLCQPPTGYDETAETWVSSGALVNRMNFALAVASGEVRGVQLAVGGTERKVVRERIVRDALASDVSAATLDTIAKATTVEQTIALAIGSPEFQRQ